MGFNFPRWFVRPPYKSIFGGILAAYGLMFVAIWMQG